MLSLPRFQLYFTANWRFGLLACIFFVLFFRLGLWQLDRAEEKKQILAAQKKYSTASPIPWSSDRGLPKLYQRMEIKGLFLPIIFLLDNQHHQHQFGYDVLSPFLLPDNKIILIDRGWVVGNLDRSKLPDLKILNTTQTIIGNAYYPAPNHWFSGEILDKKIGNVSVIEFIDTHVLGQILHKSVYPFIIRMDPGLENGFVREWSIVSMPPERHLGYAVQWFALALLVIILFIVLSMKKRV